MISHNLNYLNSSSRASARQQADPAKRALARRRPACSSPRHVGPPAVLPPGGRSRTWPPAAALGTADSRWWREGTSGAWEGSSRGRDAAHGDQPEPPLFSGFLPRRPAGPGLVQLQAGGARTKGRSLGPAGCVGAERAPPRGRKAATEDRGTEAMPGARGQRRGGMAPGIYPSVWVYKTLSRAAAPFNDCQFS